MRPRENIEKVIKKFNIDVNPEKDRQILDELRAAQTKSKQSKPGISMIDIRRIIMHSKMTKLAVAAVIIIAALIGINQFGGSIDIASVAWGEEIVAAIENIKGVSCREQIFTVTRDGSEHLSSTWHVLYFSKDSYRKDIYDGDTLREIQWYVPDGENMLQHSIRFDLESYYVERHQGSFGMHDPIDRVRFFVQFMDRAEQWIGTKKIEGANCVGFEIKANVYGDNPEHWLDQIWFDVETKLPVVIEKHLRPVTDQTEITFTTVQDEFNYDDELSGDTFDPYVPDGYIFGHPDEITSK